MRKIKPMEIVSPSNSVDYASKQKTQDKDKESDEAMPLSSSVTVVREMSVSQREISHISLDKSGKLYNVNIVILLKEPSFPGNSPVSMESRMGTPIIFLFREFPLI